MIIHAVKEYENLRTALDFANVIRQDLCLFKNIEVEIKPQSVGGQIAITYEGSHDDNLVKYLLKQFEQLYIQNCEDLTKEMCKDLAKVNIFDSKYFEDWM